MPRADRPSSPAHELAARRGWHGPTLAEGVLTPELAEFCQSGVSVVIASCDGQGLPVVGRGLACRIDGSGRVRVILRRTSNAALLRALAAGGGVAVTFTKPHSHRSIQLKATRAEILQQTAPDGPATVAQISGFRGELVDVGYSDEFSAGYCTFEPYELGAIEFVPGQAFVQTPGPSAGSALEP